MVPALGTSARAGLTFPDGRRAASRPPRPRVEAGLPAAVTTLVDRSDRVKAGAGARRLPGGLGRPKPSQSGSPARQIHSATCGPRN